MAHPSTVYPSPPKPDFINFAEFNFVLIFRESNTLHDLNPKAFKDARAFHRGPPIMLIPAVFCNNDLPPQSLLHHKTPATFGKENAVPHIMISNACRSREVVSQFRRFTIPSTLLSFQKKSLIIFSKDLMTGLGHEKIEKYREMFVRMEFAKFTLPPLETVRLFHQSNLLAITKRPYEISN